MSNSSNREPLLGQDANERSTERSPWTRPLIRQLRAGSAEAGANPINPEGALEGS